MAAVNDQASGKKTRDAFGDALDLVDSFLRDDRDCSDLRDGNDVRTMVGSFIANNLSRVVLHRAGILRLTAIAYL